MVRTILRIGIHEIPGWDMDRRSKLDSANECAPIRSQLVTATIGMALLLTPAP
jgi:hypothetical protein